MDEGVNKNDIILPEEPESKKPEPAPKEYDSLDAPKKKKPILAIIIIVAFVSLVASLVIVILDSNRKIADLTTPTEDSGSSYYDSKAFNSSIAFARERLNVGDYDSAEYALRDYQIIERMTATQKYRYFALLADLYSESALNNAERCSHYTALAEENLAKIREGEE